jgi:hypothetical protein
MNFSFQKYPRSHQPVWKLLQTLSHSLSKLARQIGWAAEPLVDDHLKQIGWAAWLTTQNGRAWEFLRAGERNRGNWPGPYCTGTPPRTSSPPSDHHHVGKRESHHLFDLLFHMPILSWILPCLTVFLSTITLQNPLTWQKTTRLIYGKWRFCMLMITVLNRSIH